jgi:pSer/pThr/pTyr-binding forkhead associated (FHA) protein
MVKGIKCKREHFNSPKAAFCGVCGISMVQQTHQLVDGPRPPLGVIVLDDGTTFGLDADYVLGREPENDADVMAGRVRGLPIEDPDGSVSRVHALIKLEEWEVLIVDRGSANGTSVAPPGTDAWTSLAPHEPALIVPGTKVQLGGRTFVFDAHNL